MGNFVSLLCPPLFLQGLYFTLNEFCQLFRLRQFNEIFGNKELCIEIGRSVFDHLWACVCAKQDSDGRIVTGGHLSVAKIGNVSIELAEMFVTEFIVFEFYDNVTMEDAVVEHEIGKIVAVIDNDAFLPGLKTEAIAKFKEKFL